MGRSYKNFWSLNVDEAVVASILRDEFRGSGEVFFPFNAQMKDIDLVLMNCKNKKNITIQVKGSRAYEPSKMESGAGSPCWFKLSKAHLDRLAADYLIFLLYTIREGSNGRRQLESHTVTLPTSELQRLTRTYKKISKTYHYNYYIWVDPVNNSAFDFRDERFELTKYLDKAGFNLIQKSLK